MTRLKPRRGSYETALDAFSSGDFSSCVDLLSESTSLQALMLRARAFIRLGESATAIDLLRSADHNDAPHEEAAEALALQCYALQVLGEHEKAASLAVEARARCFSAGLAGIEGELLFASAMASVRDNKLDLAEQAALDILALVDESPSWVAPRTYAFSLGFWRARACAVLGSVESLRANYEGQASWLFRAFNEFDRSGVTDDYTLVSFLANYADVAVTLASKDIIDFIVERSSEISWNSNLVSYEYRVFSLLAEAASATGDQLGALRYFRRCLDCAPNAALQIRAGVERGRLLHDIGESLAAREEIDHALRLSRAFNWEAANSLEHRQLLFLAAQVAKFDAPLALTMMSRYDALQGNSSVAIYVKDSRFRGEEFMARSAVFAANGNTDRAVVLLFDALETFTSAGLGPNAAIAAAELAALTNESAYLDIARQHCVQRPHSILARKIANCNAAERDIECRQPEVPKPATAIRSRPKLELLS